LFDGALVYYSITIIGVISKRYHFYLHRALFSWLYVVNGTDFGKIQNITHAEKKHDIKKKTFTLYINIGRGDEGESTHVLSGAGREGQINPSTHPQVLCGVLALTSGAMQLPDSASRPFTDKRG
jgi:hypothetical protein